MEKLSKAEQRIKDELETIDIDQAWDEYLDDVFGVVSIAGMEFDTSRALRELDEIAYKCGQNDWVDTQCSENQWYELDGEYYNHDEAQEILDSEEDAQ